MKLKLKALCLGLLAAVAIGAVGPIQAPAGTGGHFSSSVAHTSIEGIESFEPHHLHFNKEGGAPGERIGCTFDEYVGTATSSSFVDLKLTPRWSQCYTTGSPGTKFDIQEQACYFLLKVGNVPATHNTMDIFCQKAGEGLVIEHPNCTIKIPPQAVTGVSYTNVASLAKQITLTTTIKGLKVYYHGGICVFLGTSHLFEMVGSMYLMGWNTAGNQVDLSATG